MGREMGGLAAEGGWGRKLQDDYRGSAPEASWMVNAERPPGNAL